MPTDVSIKIGEWLTEAELEFDYTPADGTEKNVCDKYEMKFRTDNGKFIICVFVDERNEFYMVCGYPEMSVPVKSIDRALKAINELNRSYRFVSIIVDPNDGELCFKGGVDYEGGNPGKEGFIGLVMGVAKAIDDDMATILKAIYSD